MTNRRDRYDYNEMPPQRRSGKKKKRRSRLTRQQKVLVSICVVLAVAVGLTLAYKALFVEPELPVKDDTEEGIDYGDGIQPLAGGERKSDQWYTVLILGRDTGGGGNTDTMLLASYDVTNQKATVMSIPRDTMVNVSWDIKRINSVYNYYGGGDKGIEHLYKEVSQLVGFEPDYQVIVEWDAVGEIVEAMGGVYFDVPRDMNYDDDTQDLHIHISKGYQKLNGEQAMGVIRYRHDNKVNGVMKGYPDGDLGRIKTQQAFLQAMLEQLLSLGNITKINEFIKVFDKNVESDLSLQNMLWFGQQAFLGLDSENVNFVTMPNKNVSLWSRTYHNYQSYVVPIADELLELVNNELSPYKQVFTLSDLDIMSVNADGSVSSSTGHVEDAKAAVAPNTGGGSSSGGSSSGGETGSGSSGSGTGGETGGGSSGSGTGGETGGGSSGSGTGGETGGGSSGGSTGGENTEPEVPAEPDLTV